MRHPTLLLIAFACGLASCKKESFEVVNLNGGRIIAQGHGGMGIHSLYPLSSPSGILSCLYSGADGTEIDVQLTADSVLIAYHREDLADETDLSGPVISRTWAEISNARYTAIPYSDEHPISLDDLFANASIAHGKEISLDLKVYPGGTDPATHRQRFARALVRLMDAHGLYTSTMLEAHDPDLLSDLKSQRPDLLLFYHPVDFEQGIAVVEQLDLQGLSMSMEDISSEQITEAHGLGRWIMLWDVDERRDNEAAIRLNPEIIQSDRIEHLVGLLE